MKLTWRLREEPAWILSWRDSPATRRRRGGYPVQNMANQSTKQINPFQINKDQLCRLQCCRSETLRCRSGYLSNNTDPYWSGSLALVRVGTRNGSGKGNSRSKPRPLGEVRKEIISTSLADSNKLLAHLGLGLHCHQLAYLFRRDRMTRTPSFSNGMNHERMFPLRSCLNYIGWVEKTAFPGCILKPNAAYLFELIYTVVCRNLRLLCGGFRCLSWHTVLKIWIGCEH